MTTNPPTPSAQVFALPELLEAILLHLDMRTLLTSARRVSRTWHHLTQTSPSLQRHLFFQPSPPPPTPVASPSLARHNPLLQRHFPTWFAHAEAPRADLSFTSITAAEPGGTFCRRFPPMRRVFANSAAYARPEASWRRMLVCQPPAYGLGGVVSEHNRMLVYADGEQGEDGLTRGDAAGPPPLRMEELLRQSLMHVHLEFVPINHGGMQRPPLTGTSASDHPVANSAFRILWHGLSPDLVPEVLHELDGTCETSVMAQAEALHVSGRELRQLELFVGVRREMRNHGIVLQVDLCLERPGELDGRVNDFVDVVQPT